MSKKGLRYRRRSADPHRVPDQPIDFAKDALGWVIITALAYVYWVVMLLFASLLLMGYWHVTFATIWKGYGVALAAVSSAVYLVYLIRRRMKEIRIARYMQS